MSLEGVRVLDLATAMAGPYAATMLADLGASVIKLEKPRRGDLTRFSDRHIHGQSSYFTGINRGKLGLTADLRTARGQEIVRRLVPTVDVLIENYRPGMMDSWHLGDSELRSLNERLIYCSITAYGAAGFEGGIGNDMTCQGYSGLMDITGDPNGPPQRVGAPVVDAATAFQAAMAIVAALYTRERTGRGDTIEVTLLQSAYSLMPSHTAAVLNADVVYQRQGTGHPNFAPYAAFQCSDGGWVVLGSFHNRSWSALCDALGRPELVTDPRFIENWDRYANKDALHAIIETEMKKRTRDEWVTIYQERDVPCAPVLSINESLKRFTASVPTAVRSHPHTQLGNVQMLGSAFSFQSEKGSSHSLRAAPTLGEDTDAILSSIGYSPSEIAQMRSDGIV